LNQTPALWRIIRAAVVAVLLALATVVVLVVGVFAYHSDAAGRAQDAPADPAVTAAFKDAERTWRRHIDLPVHRLVLTSAEEYGAGNYVFVFDFYTWFGIGSGWATHGSETRTCGGGGMMSDGGFAGFGEVGSEGGLRDTRATCARDYGPGRVVAPTGR
jgi:hypothetical protein